MNKPLSEVMAGDAKATAVAGSHRMQLPRREVTAAGEKIVAQFHRNNTRPADTGTGGQEGIDVNKDCNIQ